MNEMLCAKCGAQSPEGALFCQHCGHALLCKNCGTPLLPTALACIQCGQLIPERSRNEEFLLGVVSTPPGYSHFKMHETPNVRDLDLIVANDQIEHLRDFFPRLIGNRFPEQPQNSTDFRAEQQTQLVEVTSESEAVSPQPQLLVASVQSVAPQEEIWKIFRDREGKLVQERSDLKAINKRDYIIRLAHLYMFARYQRGDEKVPRDDVFKILDEAGVKDTHCSSYIYDSGIRSDENDTLRLTLDGRDKAQQYLAEALNPSSPEGWKKVGESRIANNRTKKPIKINSGGATVTEWVSHAVTIELSESVTHSVIDMMSEQNKALFALYCLHKIGVNEEVLPSRISEYLYGGFKIQIAPTNLPRALTKSVDNKPAYVTHRKGYGYQITDSGIERIEQLLQSGK